jgi:uncharacterized protein
VRLNHEFTLGLPVAGAWDVLTDLERIAPCMPGVTLDAADGDTYRGRLSVKVGPISANYAGSARFLSRDLAAWTVSWRAEGKETRGKGGAAATITMVLAPAGTGTAVSVATDLAISGRLAQFGRGVLAEVSNRLLAQFVTALERDVAGHKLTVSPQPAPRAGRVVAPAAPAAAGTNLAELDWPDDEVVAAPAPEPAAEQLDVLRAVAVPVGKRVLVGGAVLGALIASARIAKRRRR